MLTCDYYLTAFQDLNRSFFHPYKVPQGSEKPRQKRGFDFL